MEAVPRLPMICCDIKISPGNTEFGSTLKKFIRDHYNEDPESYNKEIKELETLRQNAIKAPMDFTGCSILKRYYSQLHKLQSRFPMTDDGPACVPFMWTDIYSGVAYNITDIEYEEACILYNIGALHSKLGTLDSRSNAEGMKIACTHFQCAAWAFQHLRDTFPQPKGSDMSHDLLTFFINIMLAQAQECILEKSMLDSRKSSITAKIAAQVVDYYKCALGIMVSGSPSTDTGSVLDIVGSKVFKSWKKFIEFKMSYYTSISHLYMGNQAEENEKWGERVAWFQSAFDYLGEAIKINKNIDREDLNEPLTFTMDVIGGKYNSSKKENEFVYHDKVPAPSCLPDLKGASLVKGIPFSIADTDVSGPDIFARLVPMEAHETSSLYSEEKAKILRAMASKIEEKNEELQAYLSSLQLESVLSFQNEERIPQELLEKCAQVSVTEPDPVTEIRKITIDLLRASDDVDNGLKSISNLLQEEERKERLHQETFGKRGPSLIIAELKKEFSKYEEAHNKAIESNNTLEMAVNIQISHLRKLMLPLNELAEMVPSIESIKTEENQKIMEEFDHLVNKVEEMRKQREYLEQLLRDSLLNDDITKNLVTMKKKEDLQHVFAEELKKHAETVVYLDQNLTAQDKILCALTEANARYAETRKAMTKIQNQRNDFVNALIKSVNSYDDLYAKVKKGVEFYQKLANNVNRLLTRVKSVTNVQDEERSQIASADMRKTQRNPNLPPEPYIPKLKDYLPYMTNRGAAAASALPAVPPQQPINTQSGQFPNEPMRQPTPGGPPNMDVNRNLKPQTCEPLDGGTNAASIGVRPAPVGSEQTALPATCTPGVATGENLQPQQWPSATNMAPQSSPYHLGATNAAPYVPYSENGPVPPPQGTYPAVSPQGTPYQPSSANAAPGVPQGSYHSVGATPGMSHSLPYQPNNAAPQSTPFQPSPASTPPISSQGSPFHPGSAVGPQSNIYQYPTATQIPSVTSPSMPPTSMPPANSASYSGHMQGQSSYAPQGYAGDQMGAKTSYQHPSSPAVSSSVSHPLEAARFSTAGMPSVSSSMTQVNSSYPSVAQVPQVGAASFGGTVSSVPKPGAMPGSHTIPPTSQYGLPPVSGIAPPAQGYMQNWQQGGLQMNQYAPVSGYNPQGSNQNRFPAVSGYQSVAQPVQYGQSQPPPANVTAPMDTRTNTYSLTQNYPASAQNIPYPSQPNYTMNPPSTYAGSMQPQYYGQTSTPNYTNPSMQAKYSGANMGVHNSVYGSMPNNMVPASTNSNQVGYYPYPSQGQPMLNSASVNSQVSSMGTVPMSSGSGYSSQQNVVSSSYPTGVNSQVRPVIPSQGIPTPVTGFGGQQNLPQGSMPVNPHTGVPYPGSVPVPMSSGTGFVSQQNYQPQAMPSNYSMNYNPNQQAFQQAPNSIPAQPMVAQNVNQPYQGLQPNVAQQPLQPTACPTPPVQSAPPVSTSSTSSPAPNLQLPSFQNQHLNSIRDLITPPLETEPVSSDAAEKEPPPPVLQPKVIDINSIAKVKEKEPGKDPLDDPSVQAKFVSEVEKYEKFVEGLVRKSLNGTVPLDAKWKELVDAQDKESRKLSISVARCYPLKNRFPDVMPYDSNRVQLVSAKDDYINASYLKDICPSSPVFVITQSPLPTTFSDFWLMVWEQQVETLICLLSDSEIKSHVYFPKERGQVLSFGAFETTLHSHKEKNGFTERMINVTHNKNRTSRVVVHLQFTQWLVSGIPQSPASLLSFVSDVLSYQKQQRNLMRPVVVHCSAGIGRSGCFCLIMALVNEMNGGHGPRDVAQVACTVSNQRKFLIQDKEQMKFCYDTVLYYAQDILMKRGILVTRASFEDKLPNSGNQSTHVRHPSEDFILGSGGLAKLQSGVEKMGLSSQPSNQDLLSNGSSSLTDQVASEGPVSNGSSSHPDEAPNANLVSNGSPSHSGSGDDVKCEPVQSDAVENVKEKVENVDGNEVDLDKDVDTAKDVGEGQDVKVLPSITSLLDPLNFTLDGAGSPAKKKITKENFMSSRGSLSNSSSDSADPLSQLDPLWSLKK